MEKRTKSELIDLFSGLKQKPITDGMMRQLINSVFPSEFTMSLINATQVKTTTSEWSGILTSDEDTVQKALDVLDTHTHDSRYYTETEIDNILAAYETVQGAVGKYIWNQDSVAQNANFRISGTGTFSNKVGIGISNPGFSLHMNVTDFQDGIRVSTSGANQPTFVLNDTLNSTAGGFRLVGGSSDLFQFGGGQAGTTLGGMDFGIDVFGDNESAYISLRTNDIKLLSGEVQIDTINTAEMANLLGVTSSGYLTTNISNINSFILNQNSTSQVANIKISGDIVLGGKLGLGTDNLVSKVVVLDSSPVTISTINSSTYGNTNTVIGFFSGGYQYRNEPASFGGVKIITDATAWYKGRLGFFTNDIDGTDTGNPPTEKVTISSSGNLGINTTSPTEKLDVNGNARIRSIGTGTMSNLLGVTADGTLTTNVPTYLTSITKLMVENVLTGAITSHTHDYAATGHTHTGFQPLDADLTAIASLAGTSGLLKKTTTDTWALDTSTYLTSIGTGVTNELTYWSGTNTIGSLTTATYPSLTELSYVKGVTSAIQTQLNAKQATLVSGTNIKTINSTSLLGSGDIAIAASQWVTGTYGIKYSGNISLNNADAMNDRSLNIPATNSFGINGGGTFMGVSVVSTGTTDGSCGVQGEAQGASGVIRGGKFSAIYSAYGIGIEAQGYQADILANYSGHIRIKSTETIPITDASYGTIFPKYDGKLYYKNPGGTVYEMTNSTTSGTVTSVAVALPSIFSVSGSPITTAGTITGTFVSQTAKYIFAAPNAANGIPSFRLLVESDLPALSAAKTTSGTFATARLGSGTANNTTFLRGDKTWAAISQMTYPGAGIAISTGSAWGTSLTGTTNYLPKWSNTSGGLSNSIISVSGSRNLLISTNEVTANSYNTFIGGGGASIASGGTHNTAFGNRALNSITSGLSNTSVGSGSLSSVTSGYSNTSIGTSALLYLISGNNNIGIGASSLQNIQTGYSNIAIGNLAGAQYGGTSNFLTSATNSIFIGDFVDPSGNGGDNEIVIGINAVGNGSNTATWGNTSILNHYFSGAIRAAQFKLSSLNSAPASATATGTTGEIRYTSTHIYLCTATNTWVRAALSTW